jgi:methyl coenzyme M reductase subunit D
MKKQWRSLIKVRPGKIDQQIEPQNKIHSQNTRKIVGEHLPFSYIHREREILQAKHTFLNKKREKYFYFGVCLKKINVYWKM